jgi:preprotein translocase subunit YajC
MSYEPKLVTPFDGGGLIEYYKPWLIGNQAFAVLDDAYAWRGTIRKREGYSLLATMPTSPVQGLRTYYLNTGSTLNEQLIGFSTTKAYLLVSSPATQFNDISFFQTSGAAISWTGTATDFFWTSNYAGSLWTTNNVDPLRFWNGTPGALAVSGGWNNQRPTLNGSNVLQRCLMVIPYCGRLVVFSTVEGTINAGTGAPTSSTFYFQRARWSQRATPYVPATGGDPAVITANSFGSDADAWRDDIPGRGGYADAATSERIVSAAIIKNTLIVFFQNSTWRLNYTGNEVLPFEWERINTQYGAEATFSTISFDEQALAFSRRGFIASDTNSVLRIDEKIPDQVFFKMKFGSDASTIQRIHGIRDYYRQMAYWCYQDTQTTGSANNKVLAYNYLDKTWARFNQPFRCFGYYKQFNDLQWQNATFAWSDANIPWQGSQQSQFPAVVAGDASNGNVYVVYDVIGNSQDKDGTVDVANFGFDIRTKRFNPYISEGRKCKLSYVDLYCTFNPGGEITVKHYVDDQSTPVMTKTVEIFSRGVISISSITVGATTQIVTATNHGLATGDEITIGSIVGTVSDVLNNQTFAVTVVNATTLTIAVNTIGLVYSSGGYIWESVLPQGDAKYVRVFLGAVAHMHQLQFTLTPAQIAEPTKGTAQFEMQGFVAWFRPEGRIRG